MLLAASETNVTQDGPEVNTCFARHNILSSYVLRVEFSSNNFFESRVACDVEGVPSHKSPWPYFMFTVRTPCLFSGRSPWLFPARRS